MALKILIMPYIGIRFLAIFWQENECSRHGGLKTGPKIWTSGWTFWINHYLENLFSKIRAEPPWPLPLKNIHFTISSIILCLRNFVYETVN